MGPQDHQNIIVGYPPEYRDDATSTVSTDETVTPIRTTLHLPSDASYDDLVASTHPPLLHKYVPPSIHTFFRAVVKWVQGPQPPRPYTIRPFFPEVQSAPLRYLDRYFPKRRHKIALLVAFYACWFALFALVLHKSTLASDIPRYGSPVRIDCAARFWRDGNRCGLHGNNCRPFDNATFAFRCPANCKRVEVVNPHAVGAQEINYRPLVIGGSTGNGPNVSDTVYRGDSFICGSAIHAGIVNDRVGGCGVLSLIGEKSSYPSVDRNHISSIGFDSHFPMAFSFVDGTASQCRDLRWPLFSVSLTFTILLSLFTTAPSIFFPSVFVGIFFHVALVSDPPGFSDYHSIVSTALGRFLPAAFCAIVVYKYCVRRQMTGLRAQVEKTILWLGGCWTGALNNYTFDKIPIQRLTPHDIKQQPGAVPALVIIVLSIFFIALGQAWCLRIEGRLPRYLAIYGTICASLLTLVAVPKMNVRIHHYILALLLLPGTAMQTRPALLYQGLLVGLFINGIARWGFDSILQTPAELRGDAQLGTPLPVILPPIVHNNWGLDMPGNVTFEWVTPMPKSYDGLSILVNDVERFRTYSDSGKENFTWVRKDAGLPEYFRFGYMKGRKAGDYTKAGIWETDGSWTEMQSGPSR